MAFSYVIYNEDNRLEISDASLDWVNSASESVAGQILGGWIERDHEGNFLVEAESLRDSRVLCSSERFEEQRRIFSCTGFLIAEDLLMTAGHCMRSELTCENSFWIFGEKSGPELFNDKAFFLNDRVFACKKIIKQKIDKDKGVDYAIIKLDRKPPARRRPLKVANWRPVNEDTEVVLISHPLGLPLKVDEKGVTRSTGPLTSVVEIDAFKGSSGGPVFDAITGYVVGMLTSGEDDFVLKREGRKSCYAIKKCDSSECKGETVLKIAAVSEISNYLPAVVSSQKCNFATITSFNF